MMDWNDVRFFLALARTGSVRSAGARLGVSHSTVARRVDALEAQLQVRLFDRSREGYTLTDAGHSMRGHAERMETEASALERSLAGQDDRLEGTVRLTCTDTDMSELLLTELTELLAVHPGIELQVSAEARNFDLSRREADIACRAVGVGTSPAEHLLGTRLAPIVLCSYVGVAHADRLDPVHGHPSSRWLGHDDTRIMGELVGGSSHPDLPVWGTFSSMRLLAQAARMGLGIALLPTYVGDRDPTLRRLTQPDLRHLGDFWMVSHPDLRSNARLRVARAAVRAAIERHHALFAGTQPCHPDPPAPAAPAPLPPP